MTYIQSLAASSNMPYVNITLGVGAAIISFKFHWSNFTRFEDVVIYLGGFHFMIKNSGKHFFHKGNMKNLFKYIAFTVEYRNSFYVFP